MRFALGVLNTGRDQFLMGTVPSRVATVELRFRNGETPSVEPVQGVVLYPLTREQVASGRPDLAVGFGHGGREVDRQRFEPPHP